MKKNQLANINYVGNDILKIRIKSQLLNFHGHWNLSPEIFQRVSAFPPEGLSYDVIINVAGENYLVYPGDSGNVLRLTSSENISLTVPLMDHRGDVRKLKLNGKLSPDRHTAEEPFETETGSRLALNAAQRQGGISWQKAEDQLREHQGLLESVIQSDIVALSVLRPVRDAAGEIHDFEWVIANKLLMAIAKGRNVIGKRYTEIFPQARDKGTLDLMKKVMLTGVRAENEYYHEDENIKGWFRGVYARMNGFLIISSEDITLRISAENEIKNSQRKLETLVENTPDIITRWNREMKLVFANAAFSQKTGVPNESLYGKDTEEMGHPADISEPWMEKLKSVFKEGESQTHYNSFPSPTGTAHFFTRLVPERNTAGEVETVLSIGRDITDLRKSQQDLLKSLEVLEHTEEVAGIGSWEFVPSTREFSWSEGMYRIFGLKRDAPPTPEIYLDYAIPEDRGIAETIVHHLLTLEPRRLEENLRIRVDGNQKTIKVKSSVKLDDQGNALKVLGVDFDVSAIAESARLKEINARLAELDRLKTEFFSKCKPRIPHSTHANDRTSHGDT